MCIFLMFITSSGRHKRLFNKHEKAIQQTAKLFNNQRKGYATHNRLFNKPRKGYSTNSKAIQQTSHCLLSGLFFVC